MLARFLDTYQSALQPIFGFIGATISAAVMFVANASGQISPEAKGWAELGGTFGLIGFLIYACRTLWTALQDARNATTTALAAAATTATNAAEHVATAVQAAETRMAAERAAFITAKADLEREIRTDWKAQNDKLIEVLKKLDPDSP